MAHGLNSVLKRGSSTVACKSEGKTGIGSRRIFAPHFKLQVLDSYRNDADCKGNQRATARKYGIHRRQIQKWLQVENNLRNSVACKGEEGPAEAVRQLQHRQRDDQGDRDGLKMDVCVPEERVPAVNSSTTGPLDFTTHSRSPIVIKTETDMIIDTTAPIDLSLKKPSTLTPVPSAVTPLLPVYLADSGGVMTPSSLLTSIHQPHPDVWDLSMSTLNNNNNCYKRKYCEMSSSSSSSSSSISPSSSSTTAKPVKLFKPYLDEDDEDDKKSECYLPPCCNSNFLVNSDYFYNNNNCEINSNYPKCHELQLKSYYYYHPTITQTYQNTTEYELSPYQNNYDDCCATGMNTVVPLKQRHSYSLDFKLKTIECYYQDSICKGNQRAVATKYNIHRRQVQKWLKQADELKQKNETIKHQTQMVR